MYVLDPSGKFVLDPNGKYVTTEGPPDVAGILRLERPTLTITKTVNAVFTTTKIVNPTWTT